MILFNGCYKSKCLTEIIDPEYNEFKLIEQQFNNIVAREDAINFELFVNFDNSLLVSEPLNEFPSTECPIDNLSDELVADINGELETEFEEDVGIKTINMYFKSMKL
jgi:hypothetical protein